MDKVKILLAEGMEELLTAMADALGAQYCVRTCNDGNRALELLETFAPDFVVLDLELPGLDGFTLLQEAAQKGIHPMVLALTRLNNGYIIETAKELGIQYIMMKPFAIHALLLRIAGLIHWNENRKRMSIQSAIAGKLSLFKIREQLDGYSFLVDAVAMMMTGNHSFVTKDIYPEVGKRNGRSKESIEHSIRVAICDAWKHGNPELWQTYFPNAITRPPSNMVFMKELTYMVTAELKAWNENA